MARGTGGADAQPFRSLCASATGPGGVPTQGACLFPEHRWRRWPAARWRHYPYGRRGVRGGPRPRSQQRLDLPVQRVGGRAFRRRLAAADHLAGEQLRGRFPGGIGETVRLRCKANLLWARASVDRALQPEAARIAKAGRGERAGKRNAGTGEESGAGGGELTKQERKGATTMETQAKYSRGIRPDRNSSAGAAVLESPEHERLTTKTGNGHRGDGGRAAADKELFADYAGQVAAIRKSQAVIEFGMDGTVLDANDNFLNALGYTLDEVKGRHHSMFVEPAYKQSNEYREFWAALNRGEYQAAEYKRIGKAGKEVWIQASYNPILDLSGKPFKVVKYATDMTEQKLRNADYTGQIAAIRKSQAVIAFDMNGTVLDANHHFLNALGYALEEIKGRHHSMFVDEAYRQSPEYKEFWAKLNRGEYQAEEYKRIGKGGREVWIQASYNPILDLNGKPFKVVKYAIEVTAQKLALNAMLADAALLTKAAVEGKLATRADATKHQGDFRKVVEGVNATLDAVIGPLNVSAEYVDRISKGDIPPKITDSYNGDFNEIKNNLNVCIDAVNALVADAGLLTKAAVEGKLATRADATKHQGDFRKVVEGVNATLDAVIGPLNVSAEYVDRISRGDIPPKITDSYNGDFNEIKNNLNACIDAVNALVADAGVLTKAAVEGKLDTRADAGKHQGDFRKVVEGVNATLDAVIGPLNVSAEYVDRISKGDIPPKITDSYNGDFNEIKNNLNVCIDAVNALVADAGV